MLKTFTFNPFQENTYVLYDESGEAAVIDAGCLFPQEEQELKDFITGHGLSVQRVINTHLHLDHQFGNRFMHDTFGIAPEAHALDDFLIDTFPIQVQAFGLESTGGAQPLKRHIADGEQIVFGHTRLTAIHVPGHSPGSLAFYDDREGILFSGDVLFQGSIGRTDLIGGDHPALINSIGKRLFTLPDSTVVYPGHGAHTTIGYERAYNPFFL